MFRYGVDCYAYALLAAGNVDLVVESGLKPYDVGALIPLVEQAGGIVTTWDGGRPENGGNIIAAGSRAVYEQAMELLLHVDSSGRGFGKIYQRFHAGHEGLDRSQRLAAIDSLS